MACHRKCNGIECLIHVLQALAACKCDCGDEGCITLNQGHHQITVNTDFAPGVVYLSAQPIGTPVCVGAVDLVGYTLLPKGFIIHAVIKSNSAEVCYFVEPACPSQQNS